MRVCLGGRLHGAVFELEEDEDCTNEGHAGFGNRNLDAASLLLLLRRWSDTAVEEEELPSERGSWYYSLCVSAAFERTNIGTKLNGKEKEEKEKKSCIGKIAPFRGITKNIKRDPSER